MIRMMVLFSMRDMTVKCHIRLMFLEEKGAFVFILTSDSNANQIQNGVYYSYYVL
jgi:hypothetical protein